MTTTSAHSNPRVRKPRSFRSLNISQRQFLLLVIYTLAALPWLVIGATRSLEPHANSPIDWVTDAFAPRAAYDRFREAFGQGDLVIASWPGCTVDDAKLDNLLHALRRSAPFFDDDRQSYFQSVTSGRELVARLTAPPLGLSQTAARRRLLGTVVGPDLKTTAVLITFTPDGLQRRRELVRNIQAAITYYCHVPDKDQHLAGPIIDGLAVDLASEATLQKLAVPSSLVIFGLCYLSLRSFRAAALVCAISLYAQLVTLALVYYGGREISALMIVLPPLIQVMAVAGGIHLVNYYIDLQDDSQVTNPAAETLRAGWLPCFLSAATTAIGLGSLVVSRLVPIRDFGIFAAIGTMTTCALTLLFVPGTFTIWKWRPAWSNRESKLASGAHTGWVAFADVLIHHHRLIIGGTLVICIAFGLGLPYMRTSVRLDTMFSAESRVMSDYDWLETHLGPLVPIEILVQFKQECRLSIRDRLQMVQEIQQRLRDMPAKLDSVSSNSLAVADPAGWRRGISQSALTFMPTIEPPAIPIELPAVQRAMIEQTFQAGVDRAIQGLLPSWKRLGYLHQGPQHETWRVTTYVDSRDDLDYGLFINDVQSHLLPVTVGANGATIPGATLSVTGVMPLVHGIQRQLMTDLFQSFLSAFAIITLLMTVLQGGFFAGLLSMASNIFPTIVIFGGMGWTRLPMDIGSVMTASLALGIAVDDTLHFLTFFRRGLSLTGDRHQAVRFALQHCGRAMVQTTVVLTLGMSVFGISDFLPTCRFAWMLVLSLIAALLGDLILLPALLASRLGGFFEGGELDEYRRGQPAPGALLRLRDEHLENVA